MTRPRMVAAASVAGAAAGAGGWWRRWAQDPELVGYVELGAGGGGALEELLFANDALAATGLDSAVLLREYLDAHDAAWAASGHGPLPDSPPPELPATEQEDVHVFHAGTALQDGQVVTAGGRVLCVTALGDNVRSAQKRAYEVADGIVFEGRQYRRDIGHRAIGRKTT